MENYFFSLQSWLELIWGGLDAFFRHFPKKNGHKVAKTDTYGQMDARHCQAFDTHLCTSRTTRLHAQAVWSESDKDQSHQSHKNG